MRYLSFLLLLFANNVFATWLDGDAACNTYGCVVVCDLDTCDVYDVSNRPGAVSVPIGSPLIYYAGNPVVGAGTVNTNYRNTFTNVTVPAATSGTNIQINNPLGGPNPTLPTDGGALGYLDAGDTLVKFGMQANTNIKSTVRGQVLKALMKIVVSDKNKSLFYNEFRII